MNTSLPSRKLVWTGRILSAVILLLFTFSAYIKIFTPPDPALATLGLSETMVFPLAMLELLCIVTYLIPMTSVLGAVLFTGYMGGAILTHWRVGEAVYLQVCIGVLVWLGLYLREPRLWQLLPFRRG